MDRRDSIKILVASSKYPPEYAGSGLRAHRTYKRLKERYGFDYSVLCSSVVYNGIKVYKYEDVRVCRIACKLFKAIKNSDEIIKESLLEKLLRKFKNGVNYIAEAIPTWIYLVRFGKDFDLIHIFGNNNITAIVLMYAKITNKPLILEVCNVSMNFRLYEPGFMKKIFTNTLPERSKVICISERIRGICIDRGYSSGIWCRPNPVENSRFFIEREKKLSYRKTLGLFSDSDIVLLNIGKIYPLKNQDFLIEVLKDLSEQYKLVLAGPLVKSGPDFKRDRDYLDRIREKIERYRLADRVKIEDRFVQNVEEYIKASDLYLLPSRIEACATPVLEALACGIPVVAHRIEGVTTEWIKDGVNGCLSGLDVELFRDKIKLAVTLNKEMTEKSAGEILKIASSDLIDERYNCLIRELLNRG